jgi:hypothetical protein
LRSNVMTLSARPTTAAFMSGVRYFHLFRILAGTCLHDGLKASRSTIPPSICFASSSGGWRRAISLSTWCGSLQPNSPPHRARQVILPAGGTVGHSAPAQPPGHVQCTKVCRVQEKKDPPDYGVGCVPVALWRLAAWPVGGWPGSRVRGSQSGGYEGHPFSMSAATNAVAWPGCDPSLTPCASEGLRVTATRADFVEIWLAFKTRASQSTSHLRTPIRGAAPTSAAPLQHENVYIT